MADMEVMDEIRNLIPDLKDGVDSLEAAWGGGSTTLDALIDEDDGMLGESGLTGLEAIIMINGRPSLLIQDGEWQTPKISILRERLERSAADLKRVIPSVGRLEVMGRGEFVGTGWMIEEDVLITNRHVADIFAMRVDGGFSLRRNSDDGFYQTQVDFKREHERPEIWQVRVEDIVYLEEAGQAYPDMALVRLASDGGGLPEPVELDAANPRFDDDIAVIGYPAKDGRNDAFVMNDIFENIYNVKRLGPGKVRGIDSAGRRLLHDCSTLGGSSGSLVMNLNSGKACGLHYAGSYLVDNYAIPVSWLKKRLSEIAPYRTISVPKPPAPLQG